LLSIKSPRSTRMDKIKILFVITRLNSGGAAKCAIWLSGMLDEKKFKTVLISGKTEGNENAILWYARKHGVSPVIILWLKRSLNPFSDLISFLKLYRLILKEKPDIVHTHMSKAGLLGRTAAIFYNRFHQKKIKIVHTFHGHVFHSYFSGIKTRLFVFLEKRLLKNTDAIIAISRKLRDEICHILKVENKKKLRIIPLGIDFLPVERVRSRKLPTREIHIGMLGRLAPVKNYSLAVEIASMLARGKTPAKILIGGGGSRRDFKKINQYNSENISFLGNIKKPEDFWKKIDIALITSKNEGTPVSLIEAMFSGIPFIASMVGGIPDMATGLMRREGNLFIYDNCILIKGFDSDDFEKAIRFFSDSEIRRNAGKCGKRFAEEKYSVKRLIKDIEILYSDLLENE